MKTNFKLLTLSLIVFGMTFGFSNNDEPKNSNTLTDQSGANLKTSSVCVYSWTSQTSGTTNQLLGVSAVSDLIAWSGGANGTVRKTIDGSSWTNGNPNAGVIQGNIRSISAIDANIAICTSSPLEANIYKTVNGGANWTRVYTSPETAIHSILMISSTEGYAIGSPKPVGEKWIVLKTIDGGNTWNRMATEPSASNDLEAGFNNSLCILGTHIWFGSNLSKVYHSPDLGLTWSNAGTPGTENSYSVHYNSFSMGLAGGDNPIGNAMVKSNDGGQSYSSATPPSPGGVVNGLEGFGNDWWLIRSAVDIQRSTNFGSSWTPVFSQSVGTFHDINFTIVNTCPVGWVVGNGGAIAMMSSLTGVSNPNNEIPVTYSLAQNYPNPFNPSTNISFSLPEDGLVTLTVFDITGKEIHRILNEVKSAGNYTIGFNADNLPAGTYLYRIESKNFIDTKKMLLIK